MKFRSLHKWTLSNELEGLVFFAQRFDEMLFDYTLDSYKPSALNAPSLCDEALAVITAVEKGYCEAGHLEPVMLELEWSIQNDAVAKSLMDVELEHYILRHEATPLPEKKLRLEVLARTLDSSRYIERCVQHLRNAVVARHKGEINDLARALATTLVNHGISKAHLYQRTQEFFFKGEAHSITAVQAFDRFIDAVLPTLHDFDVFFIASKDLEVIEETLGAFRLKRVASFPEKVAAVAAQAAFAPGEDECILQTDKIRAYDCHSARMIAERYIDMLRDLFTLFSHRDRLHWREKTLISQCCIDAPVVVGTPKSAMQKRIEPTEEYASAKLNRVIGSLGLRFGSSFGKFNRIADLHGICVTNDVPENQLLNLWISLETLVPGKGAKIGRVVSAVEPFVRRGYVRRLLIDARRDLMIWDRSVAKRILGSVPESKGRKILVRLLYLLALSENEGLRKELYAELKDFHLLRYRLYCLHTALQTPKSVRKLIDDHWQRVDWQLRRIYRTRNSLVHDGEAPPYLGTLIENGHDYLDLVLEEVMEVSCGPRQVETLDQAFELEHLLAGGFQRRLASLESFTSANIAFLCEE